MSEKNSYRYTAVYRIVPMFRNFYGSSSYTDGQSPPTIDTKMQDVRTDFNKASKIPEQKGYKEALLALQAAQAVEREEWEDYLQRKAATKEQTQKDQSQG